MRLFQAMSKKCKIAIDSAGMLEIFKRDVSDYSAIKLGLFKTQNRKFDPNIAFKNLMNLH